MSADLEPDRVLRFGIRFATKRDHEYRVEETDRQREIRADTHAVTEQNPFGMTHASLLSVFLSGDKNGNAGERKAFTVRCVWFLSLQLEVLFSILRMYLFLI